MFFAVAALFIVGCFGSSHDFKIRFSDTQGLHKGAAVYFDKTAIGKVTGIEFTDKGNYLISVSIEDQFSSLPKDSSTFYIDTNPETEGQKAIHIIQIDKGGNIIKNKAIVEGQTKYAAIYGQLKNRFQKNVQTIESELYQFLDELNNLSESEQIKQIEKQLDEILANIGNLTLEMKHKLESEILPRIKEQLEELRRRLGKNGNEDKLKNVERQLDTISAKIKV